MYHYGGIKRALQKSECRVDAVLDDARRMAGVAVLDLLVLENSQSAHSRNVPTSKCAKKVAVVNAKESKNAMDDRGGGGDVKDDGLVVANKKSAVHSNQAVVRVSGKDADMKSKILEEKTTKSKKKRSWLEKRSKQHATPVQQ